MPFTMRGRWRRHASRPAIQRNWGVAMKVIADSTMCEGNLECLLICPEVFAVSEDNQAKVLTDNIPTGLYDKVRLAVQACPRAALRIEE
ncbi:ferredoxin [Caenibius tardaugens]|uniref:ferredoxin n=2 Tax=Caenibius tardaugens TaxID=169176 RepID=UPI0009FEF201